MTADAALTHFRLGMQAGLHLAAERARLAELAEQAAAITARPAEQQAAAYAALAVQMSPTVPGGASC